MRIQAVVAYDGTAYSGFQKQRDVATVQGVLETSLAQVTASAGKRVVVLAAGRTDAGVHALGQVVAFDTNWRHGPDVLQRALNAVLPDDIAVREVVEAAADFHPRYDARSRRYRYTLRNAPVRCPLGRQYSLHVTAPLDVEAMQKAAQSLIGERDFGTFGRAPQGNNTVRRVLVAEWEKQSPLLHFYIEANAFLYRMVRSLVGTLLQVGRGEMDGEEFEAALAACDRSRAGPTAPPHGLCLVEVKY